MKTKEPSITPAHEGLDDPDVMVFAVFCIENLARRHQIPAESVYAAIADRSDLLDSYLVPSYDFLHTQDKEYILDDLDHALTVKGVTPSGGSWLGGTMNADPTLLQMKFARIVTKFAEKEGIPAEKALRFFYHSKLYPLLRDGVADLH